MKITERRLRQIIRSVIKENENDPYLDPNSRKLEPEDVFPPIDDDDRYLQNDEEDIRYDEDGNPYNAAEEVYRADMWNEQFLDS